MLAILPIVSGGPQSSEIPLAVGIAAVATLLVALVLDSTVLIGVTAGLLGVAYLMPLGAGLDARAPLVGAGLLLMAECAYWSLEQRTPLRDEGEVLVLRGRAIAAIVVAGGATAILPVLVGAAGPAPGLLVTVLGAAAAVGIVGVLVRLSWASRRSGG
jgi:hypothetical protein